MKTLSRLSAIFYAGIVFTAQAGAQAVDPYALYEAVQAGDVQITPQDTPITDPAAETELASEPLKTSDAELPATVEADVAPIDVTAAEPAEAPVIVLTPEAETPDAPTEDDPGEAEAIDTETSDPIKAASIALPSIDEVSENAWDAPALNRADLAPYFLSAEEYLDLRGVQPAMQTTLIYDVTRTKAGASSPPETYEVTLAVGKDYVASQSTDPTEAFRIYDFRYNRLLKITQGDRSPEVTDAPLMNNTPLYALAHRNTSTVTKVTDKGKLDTIDITETQTLEAFWIESAMSWTLNDRAEDIVMSSETAQADLTYKSQPAFSVTLSDKRFDDPDQSDAMLAFAHWNLPVHPAGLKQLYAAGPVETMTIMSKSPAWPLGQTQVWTLKSMESREAAFPLPANTGNLLTSTQTDPIAFAMNLATRNVAPGGPPDTDALADAVLAAMDADDFETAWLTAKRYEQHSRPCKKNNIRKACKAMRQIEDMRAKPESLEALLGAYEDSEDAPKRVAVLQALKPWLEQSNTPADILRLAGVVRAKIDKETATLSGLGDINAGDLIRSALLKDPYNPESYLALAQFYAATGNYDASWNVFDTLRSTTSPQSKAKFGVDKVERGLQDRAPGYFMPALMAEP